MESLGFYDGRSGEYVIGSVGECTAQTDCCARDCMSVVDLRAVAVDGADIEAEVEFCLLFRESCRKFISKIPAVRSLVRNLSTVLDNISMCVLLRYEAGRSVA